MAASPEGFLGGKASSLWALQIVQSAIKSITPATGQAATVVVYGKPDADLNRIYLVAIQIASGVMFGFPWLTFHSFKADIDHMKKIVSITFAYEASGLTGMPSQSSLIAVQAQREPVFKNIFAGNFPRFINMKPETVRPVVVATPAIMDFDQALFFRTNPQLPFDRGTRGVNNTVSDAGGLIDPYLAVPQPSENNIGSDNPIAVKNYLKKIFGF